MNTRRKMLLALGGGLLLPPQISLAQQEFGKVRRIGFLTRKTDASVATQINAFRDGLRDLGWVEGKNISIQYRDADGQIDRLHPLAAELVNLNVDVIVTVDTPPTQAAKQATKTISIVIAVSADPVGAGLVSSLRRPGGNATGLSLLAPETDQKTLELLKETLPGTRRVAMIFDPKNQGMMFRVEALKTAATKLAIEFQAISALGANELAGALTAAAKDPPDALIVLSPIYAAYHDQILDFTKKTSVPLSVDTSGLAGELGALLSYGADIGIISQSRDICGQDIEGRRAGRLAGGAADEVRVRDQPQDR